MSVSVHNRYDQAMGRTILIGAIAFGLGAVAAGGPFVIAGHHAGRAEAARGEPTMGPGITTACGVLLAPLGGAVAASVAVWVRRRKAAGVTQPR